MRVTGRREPDPETLDRARAAEDRHTERPFRPEPVPAALLDQLVRTAGTYAYPVARADRRLELAVAMSWADQVEAADPAYRAELARWVGPVAMAAGEGVPASAVPHLAAGRPRHADVPVRDFEAGARGEQEVAGDVDEQPAYLVLLSDGDGPGQRLAAGEAYLRVSVEATRLGLASSAMTQAVEHPPVQHTPIGLSIGSKVPVTAAFVPGCKPLPAATVGS